MPGIKLKEGESFEHAYRKFKKQVEKAGILSELRKREYYEKPSARKKRKMAAAKKRANTKKFPFTSAPRSSKPKPF